MRWQTFCTADPLPWLLDPDNPGARYLALRDLTDGVSPAELDSARAEAHARGPIAGILAHMDPEGFWEKPGRGYSPKYRSTVWALILLAQLGARVESDPRIGRACAYLLDHALILPWGQFCATTGPSGNIDCLQGNLCAALLDLGCADPRLDIAFDWMARAVTGEGIAPATERHAEPRYMAYKCGPSFACAANGKLACGWGAVKVMLAFSKLPAERRTPLIERAIARGIDFLFSVNPVSAAYPTIGQIAPNRGWWTFGFPVFYVTDLLQLAEALCGLGYGHDPRLTATLEFIRRKQDAAGRWPLEYVYSNKTWGEFGRKSQPNKWVTLRAARVLQAA